MGEGVRRRKRDREQERKRLKLYFSTVQSHGTFICLEKSRGYRCFTMGLFTAHFALSGCNSRCSKSRELQFMYSLPIS